MQTSARMNRRAILAGCAGSAFASLAIPAQVVAQGRGFMLAALERQLSDAFPDVPSITTAELATRLAATPKEIVLLDVRAPEEFAVSRIAGAHLIAPDTRRVATVREQVGNFDGKTVIAYCAIGLRSARLIVRIGQGIREAGARELLNVSGGLFRWRNEQRAMVDANGPTRRIHPFSPVWRQLLDDDP